MGSSEVDLSVRSQCAVQLARGRAPSPGSLADPEVVEGDLCAPFGGLPLRDVQRSARRQRGPEDPNVIRSGRLVLELDHLTSLGGELVSHTWLEALQRHVEKARSPGDPQGLWSSCAGGAMPDELQRTGVEVRAASRGSQPDLHARRRRSRGCGRRLDRGARLRRSDRHGGRLSCALFGCGATSKREESQHPEPERRSHAAICCACIAPAMAHRRMRAGWLVAGGRWRRARRRAAESREDEVLEPDLVVDRRGRVIARLEE